MFDRPFWNQRLAEAWKQVSIVWLTGPRRVGKAVLSRSLGRRIVEFEPGGEKRSHI